MDFRERKVYGWVVDGDGEPFADTNVKFKPTEDIGFTNSHFVINEPFTATTDENGRFERTLWCDEDSNVAINWNIYFPKEKGGEPQENYVKNFSLAFDDGSDIEVGYLVKLSVPVPEDSELMYQAVDQRIFSTTIRRDAPQEVTPEEQAQFKANAGIIDGGGGPGGAVNSVNGQTGNVTLGADNIAESSTRKWSSPTEKAAWNAKDTDAITAIRNGVPTAGNDLNKLYNLIIAINSIIGGSTADGDSIVNTVAELLVIFSTYPEGVNLVTALGGKINTTAIINNLTEVTADKVLDARQGKALNDLITALSGTVTAHTSAISANTTAIGTKADKLATVEIVAGTTYTILAADNGKIKRFTNVASVTVTVPTGLPVGFGCMLDSDTSDIVVSADGGVTINQEDRSITGAKSASLFSPATNIFKIQGATE